MCHFLPLIAFTHACMSCYGKITTKVLVGAWGRHSFLMAVEKKVENCNIVSSSLTIELFCRK